MQSKRPILSIIVITFNQLTFLKQTIESIVKQETDYFFELIIADDCSTDGSQEYCESLGATDKYFYQYVRMGENGGITANCNLGLSKARGKYVTLIGGDDLFLPLKIQTHVDYMEANPSKVISYHPVKIFDSITGSTILLTNQSKVDTPLNVLEIIKLCIPGSVSVLARSDAIPAGGFDKRLPMVSDWLYYIEIAAKGDVGFFDKTLACYRKHGNQASGRTYELLSESLRNLDFAKEKLPMLNGIDEAIRVGKSRYILGEAYRQLVSGDHARARLLIHDSLKFRRTVSAYGLLWATYPYMGGALAKMSTIRRLMKRIF
jgi:glycosyltransferase involved in cell wall biosynthesis